MQGRKGWGLSPALLPGKPGARGPLPGQGPASTRPYSAISCPQTWQEREATGEARAGRGLRSVKKQECFLKRSFDMPRWAFTAHFRGWVSKGCRRRCLVVGDRLVTTSLTAIACLPRPCPHPHPALSGVWLSPGGAHTPSPLEGQETAPQFLLSSRWTLSGTPLTRPPVKETEAQIAGKRGQEPTPRRRGHLQRGTRPATPGTGARESGGLHVPSQLPQVGNQRGGRGTARALGPTGGHPALCPAPRVRIPPSPGGPGGPLLWMEPSVPQHVGHAHSRHQQHVLLFLLVFNPFDSI